MDNVISAYKQGLKERDEGRLKQAIDHFTEALECFHDVAGHNYDLIFWSNILFARAHCYLKSQQYDLATKDIEEALHDCPEQLDDLVSFLALIFFSPYLSEFVKPGNHVGCHTTIPIAH